MRQLTKTNQLAVSTIRWLIAFGLLPGIAGCGSSDAPKSKTALETSVESRDESVDPQVIVSFCGHCHAAPRPDSFTRDEWRAEVSQGFRFYEAAKDLHLTIPSEPAVVSFYESQAPVSIPEPQPANAEIGCLFQKHDIADGPMTAAISTIVPGATPESLLCCNMRTGAILTFTLSDGAREVARPIELSNPCRLTQVDLNSDGHNEVLVSDLGSFFPEDHQKGSVWKLDPDKNWEAENILEGVSRVADVQAGDLDQDGDIDLVIAEFGWRRTGRVLILWNELSETAASWRTEVLDKRHGAIDVPIVDVNGDGLLDIVVLLSQEFELVECYLNSGRGRFEPNVVFDAGDPAFGSSGIQAIDFDGDGDMDVIHTNGDSFDSSHVKPFHGVRWLENKGTFPFTVHEVTQMAGVHDAAVGDVDEDGDLDIVAVSLLPPTVLKNSTNLPSIVWLEQFQDHTFVRHVVETGKAQHAACALIDLDSDGDLDIAASNFLWQDSAEPPAVIFRNESPLK
jgi:hypothetical protein